jgi:TAT (twin-arginine translocation) pathway signal sequence
MLRWDVNRREFVKMAAGAGAALALPGSLHAAVSSSKMIVIQVGAISFVDEAE